MRQRSLGVVLIAEGIVGLIGTALAFAARSDRYGVAPGPWVPLTGVRGGPTCNPPLQGQTVDVFLSGMGALMSSCPHDVRGRLDTFCVNKDRLSR